MHCDAWFDRLSASADGELDDLEQCALDAHLVACAGCHSVADDLSAMRRRLLVMVPSPAPRIEGQVLRARADQVRHRRKRLRLGSGAFAAAGVVAALMAFSVGAFDHRPPATLTRASATGAKHVVIASNRAFDRPIVSIPVGASVTWINKGNAEHLLHQRVDGGTVVDDLAPGQVETVTFDEPGTYRFRCSIHPGMTGRVEVTA